jgi:excinuclease ABC subunit B
MERALAEMDRRRNLQLAYNREHGITPRSITRAIQRELVEREDKTVDVAAEFIIAENLSPVEMQDMITDLEAEMHEAARNLEFERAAYLRDRIRELREE